MNREILGDKKKRRYNEGLFEIVNKKFAEAKPEGEDSEKSAASVIDISKIDFELGINQRVFSFDDSLRKMKKHHVATAGIAGTIIVGRDYDRHPRPREIFEYLYKITKLERGTTARIEAEKILNTRPEWTSCAFRLEGQILSVALDPKGLIYSDIQEIYVLSDNMAGLQYYSKEDFDIGSLASRETVHIDQLPSDLLKLLYGEPPKEVLESANITLPEKRMLWCPVSRDVYNLYANDLFAKSRGVKIIE